MCTSARDGYGRACGCNALHTCVRLRAPPMRPSPSRAHAWLRPPVYIANAHVMYNISVYVYIDAKSGYVINGCACVFLPKRAIACGRRRCANTIHAWVRVRRALFVTPSIDGTRTGYSI